MRGNPFYELYLADSMSALEFVRLFSPFLIEHVQPIFLPGNVVVVGMQGSGKSMLLTLLRAETRLRYDQVGHDFPVPVERRNFVSCAVNLAHSNATDFGYRTWDENDPGEVEMMFGDFVNALLVRDLLGSVLTYMEADSPKAREEAGIHGTRRSMRDLAAAARPLWNGWLTGVDDLETLCDRLDDRVRGYRGYLHRRQKVISPQILETRTSIGEPIGEFAELMRSLGIIDNSTNVFVDIDQYEELANIRTGSGPSNKEVDYRSVINRAVARRDPRLSYRIGSRRYSWRSHGQIMGSTGRLEEERDYKYVDLDLLLKRSENRNTYIFPQFAEDVFRRRLQVAGLVVNRDDVSIEQVYGESPQPVQKAKFYNSQLPAKAVSIDDDWRPATKERLLRLAAKDPLSARLGEAWVRQKGEDIELDVRDGELPWETRKAQYWKKERIDLALFQIASSNQQRAIFAGRDELCDLSNGNILIFISINQHIWDQQLRFEAKRDMRTPTVPKIGVGLQSTGVLRASEHWFNKILAETGRSAERLSFVREVARALREMVLGDRKLSYPGATGFSLREDDLQQLPWLGTFLEELADYGNLVMSSHTTKEKDRAARIKWYISPVLCPYLRLPYSRPKEPYYCSVKEVLGWLETAGIKIDGQRTRERASEQKSMF
jgi:hypothetical protein